jgi:hypothetical protein
MKIKINRENQIVINDEVVAVTKINEKMEWEPSKKTRKIIRRYELKTTKGIKIMDILSLAKFKKEKEYLKIDWNKYL